MHSLNSTWQPDYFPVSLYLLLVGVTLFIEVGGMLGVLWVFDIKDHTKKIVFTVLVCNLVSGLFGVLLGVII